MLAIQAEDGEGSGHPSEPQPPPSNAQPTYEEPIPNVVSSLSQKTQTPRQALQEDTQLSQTRPDFKEWDDIVVRATTTAASLDATHTSGNITKTQSTTIPNVPLPQGIGTGGSPRCQEAIRVSLLRLGLRSLGTDLKQSKQVYGAAYTKLIMKVKKLEKTVKSNQAKRREKIVVSDDEEDLEDSSKQGRMIEEIDQDAGITLVTPTKDSSQGRSTQDQHQVPEVNISIPSSAVIKYKGKGIMEESEEEQSKRTKLQQEQDRLGHEAAVRLQEELDEEERQRMARVHVAAQSFTEEEWENIRARVEADEELTQRLQAEERNKYSEVDQAKMLVDLINQRKRYFAAQKAEAKRNKPMTQAQRRNYMMNYIKHMGSHTL
ncbi:hypothetical protein Tco_0596562 [Tanacetum coccineum]